MDYETNKIIPQEELDKMGEELSNYAESQINQQFSKISNDMDYEKKYKEALQRAREWYNNPNSANVEKAYLYAVFPELKKSEDEKIRKALVDFMTIMWGNQQDDICGVNVEDAIAWLEKQDPKKHEEELEKAYKTADEVQYKRGYEDAVKEMEKQGGQKSDWSNKEKLMLNDIIEATERSNIFMEDYQRELVDWLKSLKQRIAP